MLEKVAKNARTGTGSETFAESRFDKLNLLAGRLHKIDPNEGKDGKKGEAGKKDEKAEKGKESGLDKYFSDMKKKQNYKA